MKGIIHFEWDEKKEKENIQKHGISFNLAKKAFFDKNRIFSFDDFHSNVESRYFCYGLIFDEKVKRKRVVTVRFTMREKTIRIIGAGFWRKGKQIYEEDKKKS